MRRTDAPRRRRPDQRAKNDGRWEAAYPGQCSAEVPEDLGRAPAANPRSREFCAKLESANRYAILDRIGDVKRPQTRAQRIARDVEMLAAGHKLHR